MSALHGIYAYCRRLNPNRSVELPPSTCLDFSSSEACGATLIVGRTTESFDVVAENHLRRLFLANYRAWLAFLRDQLGWSIGMSDILLVTGYDLTSKWATTAFKSPAASGTIGRDYHFTVSANSGRRAGSTLWGTWHSSTNMPNMRIGQAQELGPAQQQEHELPVTQCVFVRGFRVLERFLRAPVIIRAAAEPEDPDIHDDQHSSPSALVVPADVAKNEDIQSWQNAEEDHGSYVYLEQVRISSFDFGFYSEIDGMFRQILYIMLL